MSPSATDRQNSKSALCAPHHSPGRVTRTRLAHVLDAPLASDCSATLDFNLNACSSISRLCAGFVSRNSSTRRSCCNGSPSRARGSIWNCPSSRSSSMVLNSKLPGAGAGEAQSAGGGPVRGPAGSRRDRLDRGDAALSACWPGRPRSRPIRARRDTSQAIVRHSVLAARSSTVQPARRRAGHRGCGATDRLQARGTCANCRLSPHRTCRLHVIGEVQHCSSCSSSSGASPPRSRYQQALFANQLP